ncbi:GerMN domain-containing protein [Microbacterium album]|uniref:GerMN domain-containing protein n=1 Tax=Microbacterium album TaxID=2053191 RepID=A0A917IDD0_9MICO|nr:GerMN domain-containing protein [Microbacterium album]GGH37700.1 hypothetical protein GCM10010921_07800 [Microbacterium album]
MNRRSAAAAALLALLLTLAACTGFPTSGYVTPVQPRDDADSEPNWQFYPDGPAGDETPEQIVAGFVEAATSPIRGWETARQFLTSSLAETWRPESSVIVDLADERRFVESDDAIELTVTPTATVDQHGSYSTSTSGDVTLRFELVQQEDEQWRISEAPDGIVLDRQSFSEVYSAHTLAYFDPTWTYLVPDVRWFPASGNSATKIVAQLVEGAPSPWLAGSVVSAFPQDVHLARAAVPVDTDQIADVELDELAAGADQVSIGRMLAQLEASLAGAGVQSVRLRIDGDSVAAVPVATVATRPEPRALVLQDGAFGFLSGGEITPLEGLSDTIEDIPTAIRAASVAPGQQVAALLLATGVVHRVTSDGRNDHVQDSRPGQLPPVLDPFGHVWTASSQEPGRLLAWNADLEPTVIEGAWPDASRLSAIAMSRDGSRLAALVAIGGEYWAVVAGVSRDQTGAPTGIGEATRVALLDNPGIAVAWLEDTRIGIVSGDERAVSVIQQQVGGQSERSVAPSGTIRIESGTQDSSARLLTADGLLYMRRGSSWQQVAGGVSVLATQAGSPQASREMP